ncbi:MAG: OsmC family protein [Bacteroidales bacterium]|nr:OsmC family protein [Bacteroidales bacterium]
MAIRNYKIDAYSEGKCKSNISVRNFHFIIDEPNEFNGSGQGPNPVEYMLGAFAGCINITGNHLADEMNFELRAMNVQIDAGLDRAHLSQPGKGMRPGIKEVDVKIQIDTDADEDTVNTWLDQLRHRCPVCDNLANPTAVNMRVKRT